MNTDLQVYSIDDEIWVIANDADDAREVSREFGRDDADDCDIRLLSDGEMKKFIYRDDDGERTFAEEANRLKESGVFVRGIFAARDY